MNTRSMRRSGTAFPTACHREHGITERGGGRGRENGRGGPGGFWASPAVPRPPCPWLASLSLACIRGGFAFPNRGAPPSRRFLVPCPSVCPNMGRLWFHPLGPRPPFFCLLPTGTMSCPRGGIVASRLSKPRCPGPKTRQYGPTWAKRRVQDPASFATSSRPPSRSSVTVKRLQPPGDLPSQHRQEEAGQSGDRYVHCIQVI